MVYYTDKEKEKVYLGACIGSGGEGKVYSLSPKSIVKTSGVFVAKIYNNDVPSWLEEKLRYLVKKRRNNQLSIQGICFPLKILYSKEDNKFVCRGFLMKYGKGGNLHDIVFQPKQVQDVMEWTRVELALLACNILKKFIALHNEDVLMADINPFNILLSSYDEVFFIDVDSYQISDLYPCKVQVPEFTSPRLLNIKDFSNIFRTKEDEYYSIAVLLFKIFLVGKNPYARCSGGSLESYIKERNFVFPLGYNQNTEMPHGPWQAIWYNLPYDLREGFYKTFHDGDYLSPEEWLVIIEDYLKDLKSNLYTRVIFPNSKMSAALNQRDNLLEFSLRNVNPSIDYTLRHFETLLHPHAETGHSAFIEFGTNILKGYDIDESEIVKEGVPLQRLRGFPIPTCHFQSINSKAVLNISTFSSESTAIEKILQWIKAMKSVRPQIRNIQAFGGIILRSLENREEIIKKIRKETGISFGILSEEEETQILLNATYSFLGVPLEKNLCLIDVGGISTDLYFRFGEGNSMRKTISGLGGRTLRNWLFSTARSNSRLQVLLDEHDRSVEEKIKASIDSIDFQEIKLVGVGILRDIKDLFDPSTTRASHDNYSLEELLKIQDRLTRSLILNRPLVSILYNDVLSSPLENGTNRLTRYIDARLGITIYICLMKFLDIPAISVLQMSLGEAYILNHLNNKIEKNGKD